jgi:nitrite reductase/ring-hydroxylating ferredoxin subunit/alkylhydroperoxidase/carboxymuconolactone decarboxylase family protein YurZ
MSDALAFLVKARPEAMGHYLAFLKDCGTRLDPKTRCLISVITKVHAQTERGLRQYVKRALREGCSMEEVLDALLMAFPALGLSRIIWAVDVLLAMGLPEMQAMAATDAPASTRVIALAPAAPAAPPRWHDLMAAADLKPGQVLRVEGDGRSVFVQRQGRTVVAYDSRCPHQDTDIPHLALKGATLTCPKHGWAFDMATGQGLQPGTQPLTRWPARVKAGRVQAHW